MIEGEAHGYINPKAILAEQMENPNAEYAKVEIMGHRQRVGQIQEVSRFGVTLLRVDFWDTDTQDMATEYYAGSALYCVSPVSKAVAQAYEAKQKSYYQPRLRHLPAPDDDENNDDENNSEDSSERENRLDDDPDFSEPANHEY